MKFFQGGKVGRDIFAHGRVRTSTRFNGPDPFGWKGVVSR